MEDDDLVRVLGVTYFLAIGPLTALLILVSPPVSFLLRRRDALFGWAAAAAALYGVSRLTGLLLEETLGGTTGYLWSLAAAASFLAVAALLTGLAVFRHRDGGVHGVVALVAAGVLAAASLLTAVRQALYNLTGVAGDVDVFTVVSGIRGVLAMVASIVLGISLFLAGTAWRHHRMPSDDARAA